jgi:uncharacterized membrane protein YfbV (UPF0208 family)
MSIPLMAPGSIFWKIAWFNVVRAISRIGDYYISTTLLELWGDTWFLLCVAIASVFNVSVDYGGQKYIVFFRTERRPRKFIKEARLYAITRIVFGAVGFVAVVVLYFGIKIPYDTSALGVAIVMWIISYPISIAVFTGSSRNMPTPLRKRWVATRKWARS